MRLLTYGDEKNPKVLAIHPMLLDSSCAAGVLEGLLERFCIVAPDLSGHGTDTGTFVSAAADAEALLHALREREWMAFSLLWAASLGAVVGLQLLTQTEFHAEAVVLESCPLVKDSPFLRRMIHNTLISKRKKALERPELVEQLLIETAGPRFGPVIKGQLYRMSEGELENIAVSCCSNRLPPLPPERQRRMFFDFGGDDFMAKNGERMLGRSYPQAHVTIHKGCNHCQYPVKLGEGYSDMVEGRLEKVRSCS